MDGSTWPRSICCAENNPDTCRSELASRAFQPISQMLASKLAPTGLQRGAITAMDGSTWPRSIYCAENNPDTCRSELARELFNHTTKSSRDKLAPTELQRGGITAMDGSTWPRSIYSAENNPDACRSELASRAFQPHNQTLARQARSYIITTWRYNRDGQIDLAKVNSLR